MGNWVGKPRGVHPVHEGTVKDSVELDHTVRKMRIKVRMTKGELKELMAQVDMTNGGNNSENLGVVILKECMEGRLSARVVAVAAHEDHDPKVSKYAKSRMFMSTISEEEHHHLMYCN